MSKLTDLERRQKYSGSSSAYKEEQDAEVIQRKENIFLIGICGAKYSGKTTASNFFLNKEFERVSFASPLKEMLIAMGLTNKQVYGDRKEIPIDLLNGKTPRHAMQTLGTEWGRSLIGEDLWINVWKNKAEYLLKHNVPSSVIVDDIRFQNEIDLIHSMGGIVIRIHRPLVENSEDAHASEQSLNSLTADFEVSNDRDIKYLNVGLEAVLDRLIKTRKEKDDRPDMCSG